MSRCVVEGFFVHVTDDNDVRFMGEETYTKGQKISEKPVFIVDPIDGTTNFIHGYPFVCISLGFCVDSRPAVGIVYNPFTSKLYSAIRGNGAFVRDVKSNTIAQLPLTSPLPKLDGLKDALVAIEWGSDRAGTNWESRVKLFSRLGARDGGMVHGFRSTGSAAMNMCSVAAGESDAFWEAGAWAWDVAAGWAILEEAGGRIVDAYPMVIAKDWEARKPDVEGRMYFGVRKASEEEQLEVVKEYWNCVGDDLKFVYE